MTPTAPSTTQAMEKMIAEAERRAKLPMHYSQRDRDFWAACVRELKAAREIIDNLPKTADGVPVTPGMMVFDSLADCFGERGQEVLATSVTMWKTIANPMDDWDGEEHKATRFYSTRAAALAADAKDEGEGKS